MMSTDLPTLEPEGRCTRQEPCKGACGGCSNASDATKSVETVESRTARGATADDALLEPPEQVLSTLRKDGSRRWLRPRLSKGGFWQARRIVAYVLMAVFVLIPHLRLGGKPLILLDIGAFEFTMFGWTFLPTDTFALALFVLSVLVGVVLVTAVIGRAWCGWACPQTVYMEFLFRPIDRFFDGTLGKGGTPKRKPTGWRAAARIGVYLVLAMFLAHTFLAYFVGTERLADWVRSSPIHHPTAFVVMIGTTGAMLFDFLFFREQLCTLACPYGRFQSVMLDPHSLIVGFDRRRGEPRRKGARSNDHAGVGDCIDCGQCVTVCPMGIDIRDGLQMECVNCTQCIDACDSVMKRVGKPTGLIRYASQESLSGRQSRLVRARTVLYPLVLCVALIGLGLAVASKSGFDARVIRGRGVPFSISEDQRVLNSFSIRLVNRSGSPQTYQLSIEHPSFTVNVVDESDLSLKDGETVLTPIHVSFDANATRGDGNEPVEMSIIDGDGRTKDLRFRVLGPRS
ncbi:MAG: cytochrome c oxidase accessory protein CcoG [Planctomycetota bacterium]